MIFFENCHFHIVLAIPRSHIIFYRIFSEKCYHSIISPMPELNCIEDTQLILSHWQWQRRKSFVTLIVDLQSQNSWRCWALVRSLGCQATGTETSSPIRQMAVPVPRILQAHFNFSNIYGSQTERGNSLKFKLSTCWVKMTFPRAKLTALTCHPTKMSTKLSN
jgi:hypothetical protein